jgi:hypothetical protein
MGGLFAKAPFSPEWDRFAGKSALLQESGSGCRAAQLRYNSASAVCATQLPGTSAFRLD